MESPASMIIPECDSLDAGVGRVALCFISAGNPELDFMLSVIQWQNFELDKPPEKRRFTGLVVTKATSLIHMFRNQLIEAYYRFYNQEWAFLVDDDISFPPDTLDKLMEFADPETRPIVGAPYRHPFTEGPAPSIFYWDKAPNKNILTGADFHTYVGVKEADFLKLRDCNPYPKLIRCDSTGLGCVLIHRSVFRRIIQAQRWNPCAPWFDTEITPEYMQMGEDHTFFSRVRSLGIPVCVRADVSVRHYKKAAFE